MCNKMQAIDILAEAYRRCREVFSDELCDAYLYGSYARDDYDSESDIDILVTVDMDAEKLSGFRSSVSAVNHELSLEHDITVSITAKPLEQFRRYSDILPYYRNVVKEGIRYAE